MKVRIALAIDPTGQWNAMGWGDKTFVRSDADKMALAVEPLAEGEARYWIEVEIEPPVPVVATLVAKAVPA